MSVSATLLHSQFPDMLAPGIDPAERDCTSSVLVHMVPANVVGSNPMLAETFEDPRMKFIGEKVCHSPVIMAYHAEGEGWELYATSSGKTKFWGMTSFISHTSRD